MSRRTRARTAAPAADGDSFMHRLRADHAGLSRVLREIDTQQELLRTAPESAQPTLVEAIRYLLQYQHAFHHPREDRLFERIRARAPHLYPDMQRLVREHRIGHRRAGELAAGLGRATPAQLRGRRGAQLAKSLQSYVHHTRGHMRREEAVFYARSETVLDAADWQALTADDSATDPVSDLQRLAAEYPLLAARLTRPVREVGGTGRAARRSRPSEALWHGLEELSEVYGGLLHDAIDVTRANLDSLCAVRTPVDLVRVARPIQSRTWQFAGRCVTRPSRWAIDTARSFVEARRWPSL